MKVMQVLYSGLGGHGSVVTSMIEADKKKEWEHSLLFYGIEELLTGYKNFCINNNIPFAFIKKGKGIFKTGWRAIRIEFKKCNPDAIILHSPTLIFPAWLYCLASKKRLFVVEHTPHSTKGLAEKIASFFSILLARKVVCLSAEYRQKLQQQFRLLPVLRKTIVIQNGIDLEKFHPAVKPSGGELHIGMIGRFSIQKNQAMIIDAAIKGFASGQFDEAIHFHFAGNGETLEGLEKAVTDNGLAARVHFHGLLNEEELYEFLARLDVYVHASFAETMCTSVMQAMACGLPVIASDIPGINDIVEKNKNAILFNNGDVSGLINGLTMMKNKNTRSEMSNNSRRIATEQFSSLKTFSGYSNLIKFLEK